MTGPPILDVRGLAVVFRATRTWPGTGGDPAGRAAVAGVDFEIRPGETLGLIGESGSGKTSTALALLGLLPAGARAAGRALWRGRDLLGADPETLRAIRGADIALVAQDAMAALHPLMRVERQVAEAVLAHAPAGRGSRPGRAARAAARDRAAELLARTGLPADGIRHARYAFEWSGGMRQRALIAMAVAHAPALLIADEPTAALDATTRAEILALLRRLRDESGMAMLLISHDIAAVAAVADRVAVMRGGRIIESGPIDDVCRAPRHPYTKELVAGLDASSSRRARVPGRSMPPTPPTPGAPTLAVPDPRPVLRVEGLTVRYAVHGARGDGRWFTAVDDVSLDLAAGETLCVVGESGAGKSSLARAVLRLQEPAAGRVSLSGLEFSAAAGDALRRARRNLQMVFQDPYASLNPRRRVGPTITEPLRIHGLVRAGEAPGRAAGLLAQVGLPAAYADRFPFELSGGERQRVAIARALALEPRVIVLDEPVSSLDVPTRGAIIRLLGQLQESHGLAYLLIAHDLRFVRRIADRVAVMYRGRLVETGTVAEIFERPQHPCTSALVGAVLRRPPR